LAKPTDYAGDVERLLALIDRRGDVETVRIIESAFETGGMLFVTGQVRRAVGTAGTENRWQPEPPRRARHRAGSLGAAGPSSASLPSTERRPLA
jgi:hypothetical protein